MLKHNINDILIKFLVDEEILDPSALSSVLITQSDLQLQELEIQLEIQLEKIRLEQEERKNLIRAVGARRKNAERKISDGKGKLSKGERKN